MSNPEPFYVVKEPETTQNPSLCVVENETAQYEERRKGVRTYVTAQILKLVNKHRIDYADFEDITQRVREKAKLKRLKRDKTLPQLLTDADLRKFFQTIQQSGNIEHEVMLRFLYCTSLRVNELTNVMKADVNLDAFKVFIRKGKGGKDRVVLFPEALRLSLATYMKAHPDNRYLFESSRNDRYKPRRIQQIVSEYGKKAGLDKKVNPHLFRHMMLTALTRSGLDDSQIQLISGHASKQSLEIYQHLGLESVEKAYQDAVRGFAI